MFSILESPELCHALSPYLCSHDLAQCARLSKASYRVWFPYLWRHVEFADFKIYLADLFPDPHRNGIPHPPPSTSAPRQRRSPTEMERERERALAVKTATAAYLSSIRSPPYVQLLRNGQLIQSMTFHVDEGDGPYSTPYTNSEIVENLNGQVRRRVFNSLIEKAGFNLRALEIKGFNSLQPNRPQLAECWNAAMQRSIQGTTEWALDQVVASLIATAARIASSSSSSSTTTTATGSPRNSPTRTLTSDNKTDNSSGEKPRTSIGNGRGLRFLSLSRMLGVNNCTIGAIVKTFSTDHSTLEHIDIQCCGRVFSQHIHRLLESLPTLRFLDVRCRELETGVEFPRLEAYSGLRPKPQSSEQMLPPPRPQHHPPPQQDQDPTKAPLDVWACANSLRVLRIGVSATWDFDIDPLTALESDSLSSSEVQTNPEEGKGAVESAQEHAQGYIMWCHTTDLDCQKETTAKGHDWLFTKIGTLTRLQELSLVNIQPLYFRSRPIKLHSGCQQKALEKLAGLKELRVLDLEGFQVSKGKSKFLQTDEILGVEEIDYLCSQWPKLKVVKGLVHADDMDKETTFDSSKGSETLQWLKLNRPDIQIPVSKHRRRIWIYQRGQDGDDQVARILSGYA